MLNRKKSVLDEMEDIMRRCYYDGPEDAAKFHRKRTGWTAPESEDNETIFEEEEKAFQMTLF